jgi:lipopolysaccharide assembly protein A
VRVLFWILMAPIVAVVVAVAVNNTGKVDVDLWPAPYQLQAPIYLVLYGGVLFGLLFGAVWTWIGGGRTRARAREEARRRRAAEQELARLRLRVDASEAEAAAEAVLEEAEPKAPAAPERG